MIKQYTAFKFNNEEYTGFINTSLDNDFYSESIRGSRSIIEEKIPGRDLPYLYDVEDSPLEFEMTISVNEPKDKSEIKSFVRGILQYKTYKELVFGTVNDSQVFAAQSPIYNVIFTDDATIDFIGAGFKSDGITPLYFAYITLKARCDRPYGFYRVEEQLAGSSTTCTSDIEVYPSVKIVNNTANILNNITILTNNTTLSFTQIYGNEIIEYNAKFKTIISNIGGLTQSAYSRWKRDELKLIPGNNNITIEDDITVTLSYEAAAYI